jgi:hypothetical protein
MKNVLTPLLSTILAVLLGLFILSLASAPADGQPFTPLYPFWVEHEADGTHDIPGLIEEALALGVVNVRHYGATGDGATDDTAAIQAAFDNRTDGSAIYFPPGKYMHTGLSVARTGGELAIIGASGPHWYNANVSVLWCTDPNVDNLTVAANTVIIENICFRSVDDDPNYTGNGVYLHYAGGVNGCQIRNCWFQKLGQAAIKLGKADLTTISNCTMELSSIGVDLTTDATCTEIFGCRIWGPGTAVRAAPSHRLVIQGCQCVYGGIDVDGYTHGLKIHNNYIGTINIGTIVRPAIKLTDVTQAVVSGNTMRAVGYHGIYSENGQWNLFTGNSIWPNQGARSPYCGIYLAGTEDEAVVTGNTVNHEVAQYGARVGLYTEATTTNTVVGANNFKGWFGRTTILGTLRAGDAGPLTMERGDLTVYDQGDLGPELVLDGDFGTDPAASGWTLNANWTWDPVNLRVDHASGSTATLAYARSARPGKLYLVSMTIDAGGSAALQAYPKFGNVSGQWACEGTHRWVIRASTTGTLTINPASNFVGWVDDISIREIVGGDVYAAGIGQFRGVIEDVNNVAADLTNFETRGTHVLNSSAAGITGALADGTVIGQTVRFVVKTAGNNIDISVSHHVTSDPEVIRLDAAKEWIELLWDGTDWVEIGGNGQSYP